MAYKTQKFIPHKSGVWEGKDGGVGRSDIWWELAGLLPKGHLPAMPLQDERDERGPWVLCVCMGTHFLSCTDSFVTSWTVAHQAPLSLEFSRQEYWSGLPFPSPGDLPDPGIIKPASPMHLVHRQAGRYLTTWATWEAPGACYKALIPVLQGPPLWPNHSPKDPAPNAIISGVRIWTYEFWGECWAQIFSM